MITPRKLGPYGFMALALSALPCFGAASVKVISVKDDVQPEAQPTAVFGNRDQTIVLQISNATPQSGPLIADLFQVSGDLSMPISANVRLQDSVSLTGAPSQELSVAIKFPDVKQRAQILVRLSLAGATSPSAPTSLGDLHFEVFPTTLTKELTDLLQPGTDGAVSVVLFGNGRKLHNFLQTQGVRFDDAGLDLPDSFEPGRIYLGEMTAAKEVAPTQEMLNTARVALFAPDPSVPAGIYAQRQGSGVFVQVTQPLLDNLNVDPRTQTAFLKVIHLLKPQSPPNPASAL